MGEPQVELIVRGVWRQGGRLLVCRNVRHGHLFLPGGHVEFGESAPVALQREMQEELGIDVQVGPFLGVCEASFTQTHRKGSRRHHEVNLLFVLVPPANLDPQAVVSREPGIAFDWVDMADLTGTPPRVVLLPPGVAPLLAGQPEATPPTPGAEPFSTDLSGTKTSISGAHISGGGAGWASAWEL